jgi:hypothetical protein
MINVEMNIRVMDYDDTRWVEVNHVRVQWRTVELWGFVTVFVDTDFCSTQAACSLLQIRFFLLKTPENLSRALHVVAGASSQSHFNTFHLTLCEFFPSFLTESAHPLENMNPCPSAIVFLS